MELEFWAFRHCSISMTIALLLELGFEHWYQDH